MSTYYRDRLDHPSRRQTTLVGPCAIDLTKYPDATSATVLCTCGCRKNAHVGPANRGACKPCSLRSVGSRCDKFAPLTL